MVSFSRFVAWREGGWEYNTEIQDLCEMGLVTLWYGECFGRSVFLGGCGKGTGILGTGSQVSGVMVRKV